MATERIEKLLGTILDLLVIQAAGTFSQKQQLDADRSGIKFEESQLPPQSLDPTFESDSLQRILVRHLGQEGALVVLERNLERAIEEMKARP